MHGSKGLRQAVGVRLSGPELLGVRSAAQEAGQSAAGWVRRIVQERLQGVTQEKVVLEGLEAVEKQVADLVVRLDEVRRALGEVVQKVEELADEQGCLRREVRELREEELRHLGAGLDWLTTRLPLLVACLLSDAGKAGSLEEGLEVVERLTQVELGD